MSHQSEVAVLNIMMKYPDIDVDIPEDFFSSIAHKQIYKIIRDIKSEGKEPEPPVIKLRLDGDDNSTKEYIDVIYMGNFSPANVGEYVAELEREYKIRKLHNLIVEIKDSLYDNKNADTIIEYITNQINYLKNISVGEESKAFYEDFEEFVESIIEETESGELPGFSVGFEKINVITSGIRPGNLWIIAGRPGMGKSAWMQNSARNTPEIVSIYSLEMSELEFKERELSIGSGIPLMNIRSRAISKKDYNTLREVARNFSKRNDIIFHRDISGLSALVRSIRKDVKDFGVKIVYIDYLQLLAERSSQSVHELGQISRTLKLLADELGIGIIALSQLSRSVENRDDKRPILSDLRQSGNLEEDADLVAFVYRDEYYHKDTKLKGELEFIIRKHRNGSIGTIFLKFKKDILKVEE